MSGYGTSEIATLTLQASNGNHKTLCRYNSHHYIFPASTKDTVAFILRYHEPLPEHPTSLLFGEKAVAAFQDFVNNVGTMSPNHDELFVLLGMGSPFTSNANLVTAIKSELLSTSVTLSQKNDSLVEQIQQLHMHSLFVCVVEAQYKHAHVSIANNKSETLVRSVLDFDTLEKSFHQRMYK